MFPMVNSPSLAEIHSNSQVAFDGHKQLGVQFLYSNQHGRKQNQENEFQNISIYTISQSGPDRVEFHVTE
jgi:hypothetical protein